MQVEAVIRTELSRWEQCVALGHSQVKVMAVKIPLRVLPGLVPTAAGAHVVPAQAPAWLSLCCVGPSRELGS